MREFRDKWQRRDDMGRVLARLAAQEPETGGVLSLYLDLRHDEPLRCVASPGGLLGSLDPVDEDAHAALTAAFEIAGRAVSASARSGHTGVAVFVAPTRSRPLLAVVPVTGACVSQAYWLQRPQLAPLLSRLHGAERFRLLHVGPRGWSLADVDGGMPMPIASMRPAPGLVGRFRRVSVQIGRRALAGLGDRRLVVAGDPDERETILEALPRRLSARGGPFVAVAASAPFGDAVAQVVERLREHDRLHAALEAHRVARLALGRRAVFGLDEVARAVDDGRAGRLLVARDRLAVASCDDRGGVADSEQLAAAIAASLRQGLPVVVAETGTLDHFDGIACTLASPPGQHDQRVRVQDRHLGLVA